MSVWNSFIQIFKNQTCVGFLTTSMIALNGDTWPKIIFNNLKFLTSCFIPVKLHIHGTNSRISNYGNNFWNHFVKKVIYRVELLN